MVADGRRDPLPISAPLLSLPEPGGRFQVIHHAINRLECFAAMGCGSCDQNHGFAKLDDTGPVANENSGKRKTFDQVVREVDDNGQAVSLGIALGLHRRE